MLRFLGLALALVVLVSGSARAQPKPPTDEQVRRWAEKVRELKADEQEAAFRAKMGELNPKLDTSPKNVKVAAHKDGVVREVTIPTAYAQDIRPVALFRDLEKLDAHAPPGTPSKVADVSCLRGLTKLKELNLGYTAVADLSPLADLPLEKLWLEHTPVKDARALKKMPLTVVVLPENVPAKHLEALTDKPLRAFITAGPGPDTAKEVKAIFGNAKLDTYGVARSNIETLDPIAGMPLVSLALGDAPKLKSLTPLKDCATLKSLSFARAPLVTDLTPVAKKALTTLQFAICPGIRDLTPLKDAPDLSALYITSAGVTDLGPIAGFKNLDRLWLEEMQVKSIKPLADLPNVQTLRVRKLGVTDQNFTPLTKLPRLTTLYIDVTPATAALVKKIPSLQDLNGKSLVPPK